MNPAIWLILWAGLLFICLMARAVWPFIVLLIWTMQYESVFLRYADLVIGGCRIFPLDIICLLLYAACPVLIYKVRPSWNGPAKLVLALGMILLIPAIWGMSQGAELREIIRDLRPVTQLYLFFILVLLLQRADYWQAIRTAIKLVALSGAYLVLIGVLLNWRILGVDDQWLSVNTVSGSALRGYGIISTYTYFPLALYLELVDWGSGKIDKKLWVWLLNVVVLAAAMLATFVRANVVMFIVMLVVYTIVVARNRKVLGGARTVPKMWLAAVGLASCLLIFSIASPYLTVVSERYGSIWLPELGGEFGKGTVQVRLASYELAHSSLQGDWAWLLGHGYGSIDIADANTVRYFNHNSYAWLVFNGGYLTLVSSLLALAALMVAVYRRRRAYLTETADVIAIAVGALFLAGSTGHMFGSYQPTGMVIVMLFLAAWYVKVQGPFSPGCADRTFPAGLRSARLRNVSFNPIPRRTRRAICLQKHPASSALAKMPGDSAGKGNMIQSSGPVPSHLYRV